MADSAGRVGRAYGLWVKIIVPCSNMRGCQEVEPRPGALVLRAGGPSMQIHTWNYTHTRTRAHTHTHTHTRAYTHTTYTHRNIQRHTWPHSRKQSGKHTHTHTHIRTHGNIFIHTHTHKISAHTHARTHTRTHARTHAHTHRNALMDTPSLIHTYSKTR